MTDGHRHRTIRARRDAWWVRLLRHPLTVTTDHARVERSRWTWGINDRLSIRDTGAGVAERPAVTVTGGWCAPAGDVYGIEYTLTPLGILHTLTGLTLDLQKD